MKVINSKTDISLNVVMSCLFDLPLGKRFNHKATVTCKCSTTFYAYLKKHAKTTAQCPNCGSLYDVGKNSKYKILCPKHVVAI